MKLNKDSLLKNIDRVGHTICIVFFGFLSSEQVKEKTAYLTLQNKTNEELLKKVSEFCNDHLGHNFTMLLKMNATSHNSGVNLCHVELIEKLPVKIEQEAPIKTMSLNGLDIEELTNKIRLELKKDIELSDLKRELSELKKENNNESDGTSKLAIIGQQLWTQINKSEEETTADYLGLLNELSGGNFKNEVQALNGVSNIDLKVSDEDIKIIVDFIGAKGIINFAEKIRTKSLSDMESNLLKQFLS